MVPKARQIKGKELFARMIFENGSSLSIVESPSCKEFMRVMSLFALLEMRSWPIGTACAAKSHCPSLSAILQAIGHKSFSRIWLAGPGLNQAYDWEVKQQKIVLVTSR